MLAAILLATLVPLNDLGPAPYAYGYFGGLYENGANFDPADHLAIGLRRAAAIKAPVIFLGIGIGETKKIFDAFTAMTGNDPRVNHDITFADVEAGLNPKDVQVVWLEMATDTPYHPLPPQDADAYRLKGTIAAELRALKTRYPNLQIAYLSSRVYGGYATTSWNPEPYAYESALSVRWVVMGQISWERTGSLWDTRIGDINDKTNAAPWIAWGPYLWANGTMPRSDGLTWQRDDFEADGETLSPKGAEKGAQLLLQFLLNEPTATWFRSEGAALRSRAAHH